MDLTQPSPLPVVELPACPFHRVTGRLAAAWRRVLRRREPTVAAGTQLAEWCRRPEPAAFPYDAVTDELRRAGKHFASRELLASLAVARAALRPGTTDAGRRLASFLATALDKWDDRYDNPSYLALDGLELPA